jgi:ligand-binding sensor domain-containing protein
MRPNLFYTCFIIFLFNLLSSTYPVWAQYEEKNFTRYSVKDGLSDNYITCLEQDNQGYLWIGTDAGLNRFDGAGFKKYYQSTSPLYLRSGSIWRLKRLGSNELGITSRGGFQLLNTKTYSVRNFIIPDSTRMSTHLNAAWEAVALPGDSYAVTTATGVYTFNKYGQVTFRHDAYTANDIGKKRILYGRDFFQLAQKKFLIYLDEDNLGLYDGEKIEFTELDKSSPQWNIFLHDASRPDEYWVVKHQINIHEFIFVPRSRQDRITYYNHALKKWVHSPLPSRMTDSLNWESKIVMLNDSSFVVNSRTNGFYFLKLDRRTGMISCDGNKFLRHYKIICLFIDKEKRLWAGTSEGLLKQKLQPPLLQAYNFPRAGEEKLTGGFSCVFRYKNKLYAGRFSNSKGLAIINPATMQLQKEIDFYGTQSAWNEVRSIEMYHPDTLWIGSNGGLLWFDTKTERYGKVLNEKIHPWAKDFYPVLAPRRSDGYAWICGMLGGVVARYHIPSRSFTTFTSATKPALPFNRVKNIVYDSYGDVWISGHSLARFNNQTLAFDTLITSYAGANKYNDDIITIQADKAGSLWLHNSYNGLLEYRIREKRFIAYTMEDGLPANVLQSSSPVVDNKLWVAGNNQLALFDIATKKFTIYDHSDGLPEHRPTGRRLYYDTAGRHFYLCSNEYLVRFPMTPEKSTDNSSELLIEELAVNDERTFYQPSEKMVINHLQNSFSIGLTVIDFEKCNYQFAYRLNNVGNWNGVGNQRSINLSNLAPGEYSIQVKASGKPGIEKRKELFLVIRPPFWKTWWFISGVTLLLIAIVYFSFRARVRRVRQRANIDKQLSQTEMKALQAQMNPHFIFNSLNSIREMILNNENKDASHYLSKFAHLIRMTLDQSSQPQVSLRNTMDYLSRYMEMETIRNSLFTYEVTVDRSLDVDETFVSPMLIQPFIENAIWHGVSASRKNIHVQVDFARDNEALICTVDDDGVGISQAQAARPVNGSRHQSHGINNIKNRITLLNEKYDLDCCIHITDKKELTGSMATGTRVTLQLPLEIKEP